MSPILVRPVREQLEHDRIIRLLQAKYKRKFDVAINPGNEQTTPAGTGPSTWYPDLVLHSTERGRRLAGVVEVETGESVNNLEAMSEWATFSRLRVPFHLYAPASMIDVARRLCQDMQIPAAEIWAYHVLGDQIRFTLVHRSAQATEAKARQAATPPARAANGQTRPTGTSAGAARRTTSTSRRKTAVKKTSIAAKPPARRAGAAKGVLRSVRTAPKKSVSSHKSQKRK